MSTPASSIKTPRLILRPATLGIAPMLWQLMQRNKSGIKLTCWRNVKTRQDLTQRITKNKTDHTQNRLRHWIVFEKASQRPIGAFDIYDIRKDHLGPKAYPSYWICKKHRGKGYASEALGAVTKDLQETLSIKRLEALVLKKNKVSLAIVSRHLGLTKHIQDPYNYQQLICCAPDLQH